MAPARRLLLALPLLAFGAGLGGCDAALVSECVPGADPACEEPAPTDDVVAGVDMVALFARPTADEVDAALALPRATTPGRASLTGFADGPDGSRRFLLAIDGDDGRVLTALARVPGGNGEVTPLPVVVVLPDRTAGASAADLLTAPGYGALPDRTVQVVVAYRGEALTVDGEATASDLPPDPYRADLADVRAVLGALGLIPRANPDRVALVGLGRGGAVALLVAPGSIADAVVTLGAPTDLFGASFVANVRVRLLGQSPAIPFPALDGLAAPALALRDGAATLAEARLGLVALSPARLRPGDRLPPTLALHADADQSVGVDQLQSLASALGTRGVAEVIANQSHESLPRAPAVQSRVASFLLERL